MSVGKEAWRFRAKDKSITHTILQPHMSTYVKVVDTNTTHHDATTQSRRPHLLSGGGFLFFKLTKLSVTTSIHDTTNTFMLKYNHNQISEYALSLMEKMVVLKDDIEAIKQRVAVLKEKLQ